MALNSSFQAAGVLYVDDGISLNVGNNYTLVSLSALGTSTKGSFTISGQVSRFVFLIPLNSCSHTLYSLFQINYFGQQSVAQVTVLGLASSPKAAQLNGVTLPSSAIQWNSVRAHLLGVF